MAGSTASARGGSWKTETISSPVVNVGAAPLAAKSLQFLRTKCASFQAWSVSIALLEMAARSIKHDPMFAAPITAYGAVCRKWTKDGGLIGVVFSSFPQRYRRNLMANLRSTSFLQVNRRYCRATSSPTCSLDLSKVGQPPTSIYRAGLECSPIARS